MKLIVDINRECVTNEDIKWIREKLSEVTSREFKHLCDGNTFSVSVGSDNPLKVEFSID